MPAVWLQTHMKVALFGGTGFVGSYLVDSLLAAGHVPRLLVRAGSESRVEQRERCELVSGEIDEHQAVADCLAGCDAAIFNIGLLREFPDRGITFEAMHYRGCVTAIDAAASAGVQRFLLMSANGVAAQGTAYQTTKYRAEQHLAASALDWTVFRPSVIFGDPRGRMEFCSQLRAEMIDMPIPAPLFHEGLLPLNAGRFKLSPVAIEDVAAAFVRSVPMPEACGRVFHLGGTEALEWREIITTIARACGRRKLMLPAPAWAVRTVAAMLESQPWFPITRDQLDMLMAGNVCDGSEAWKLFGIAPRRFDPESLAYLASGPG